MPDVREDVVILQPFAVVDARLGRRELRNETPWAECHDGRTPDAPRRPLRFDRRHHETESVRVHQRRAAPVPQPFLGAEKRARRQLADRAGVHALLAVHAVADGVDAQHVVVRAKPLFLPEDVEHRPVHGQVGSDNVIRRRCWTSGGSSRRLTHGGRMGAFFSVWLAPISAGRETGRRRVPLPGLDPVQPVGGQRRVHMPLDERQLNASARWA